jgi:hypothetical protein
MEMTFNEMKDRFTQEAFDRYVHLTNLLLSLSFGGLVFMLSFDSTFLTEDSKVPWLIHTAWYLLVLASLTGLGLQVKLCANPLLRLAKAQSQVEAMPENMRKSKPTISSISTPLDTFLFFTQFGSFILTIIALAAFKSMNI